MSALDKLKAKLSGAGSGAAEGLGEIDRAGNKVTLEGPSRAVDKLQGKMGQLSAGTTFTDIEKAADRVELSGLNRALDNVTNKFSVLQGAASVALGGIASQAAMKGAAFAKSFAFGPITDGLQGVPDQPELDSDDPGQHQGQQVSGLDEVNKHLNELNTVLGQDDLQLLRDGEEHRHLHGGRCGSGRIDQVDQGHRQPGGSVRLELAAGFHSDVSAVSGHRRGPCGSAGLELGGQRRYGWRRLPEVAHAHG
jgi:hypothetical protein